jgi:hypothetical protein
MKNSILRITVFLLSSWMTQGFAQPGNYGNGQDGILDVSGISILPMNAQRVTSVPNTNTLTVGSTAAFAPGSAVYIIQMDGIGKGKNEFNTVSSIAGNDLVFSSMVNNYAANVTQVIALKQFTKVRIGMNSELTTARYDPMTGVGGVLAFLVRDCVVVKPGGVFSMKWKGFQRSPAGVRGLGGIGGTGGVPSLGAGGNGGTGLGPFGSMGGGRGGNVGNAPTAGTSFPLTCAGCGVAATNLSNVGLKLFLMGGGTQGGSGGSGGAGGGGGGAGGGNGTTMGLAGTAGGVGGNGGNGGVGAYGGGIIAIKAVNISLPPTGAVFVSEGQPGLNGFAATAGLNGGNGGRGAGSDVCLQSGGSGGPGNGAGGGNGGNASGGGAGGCVYVVKSTISRPLATAVSLAGGAGGVGGAGGLGGAPGIAATTPNVNSLPCPPMPGGGSGSGGGGGGSGTGADTYLRVCDLTDFQQFLNGSNSLGTGLYRNVFGLDTTFCTVDQIATVPAATFQISCWETDFLGNRHYMIGTIINQSSGTTASLIGLLDSQSYTFTQNELQNNMLYNPYEWRSICYMAPGVAGQPGLSGLNGAAGADGAFAEETESRLLPILGELKGHMEAGTTILTYQGSDPNDQAPYEVERSTDAMHFDPIGWMRNSSDNATKFIDANPMSGANYYRLRSIDVNGIVSYSNVVHVNAPEMLPAILYPNPTTGIVYLKGSTDVNHHYRVFDAQGLEVLQGVLESNLLDLSSLKNGIYWVSIPKYRIQAFSIVVFHP